MAITTAARSCLLAALLATLAFPAAADDLYNEKTFRPLAADKRAHLPGDVLTVLIYENSSATTSADTTLKRSNDVSLRANADQHSHAAAVGMGNDFNGGGSVQRQGKLLAQMSVSVTGVAPNGDLLVAGEQLLEINSDRQRIRVEGRVRPLDITEANAVLSSRLADAKISYLGDGDLSNRQRPGLWSRLFNWVGL
ncbi:flagellar basal body L-ring protein FlgH [Massilia sp. S19_KUP03_FR1]|uniref:flagellar basal body L-ring protein FlgH n=1 Tax=Massilia sp. S19_KUP03_FR1 TaxID=3025503 RepID=UPI002FCD75B5